MRPSFALAILLATALTGTAHADPRPTPRGESNPRPKAADTREIQQAQRLTGPQKAVQSGQQVYANFAITSKSFTTGSYLSPRFAYCRANGSGGTTTAGNVSPALQWSAPPKGTQSLVLLVVDKDVPASFDNANTPNQVISEKAPRQDFYHWILVDMPPIAGGLLEGLDSKGITQGGKPYGSKAYGISGQNDYVMMSPGSHGGYDGPCPPWNDKRMHNYHFVLYALDIPSLKLPSPIRGKQAVIAMKDHILAQSETVAQYATNPDWIKVMRQNQRRAKAKPKQTTRSSTSTAQ